MKKYLYAMLLAITALASFPLQAKADQMILGTASSYAVLAGSTVTNTGSTTIVGDLGLTPGFFVHWLWVGHTNRSGKHR